MAPAIGIAVGLGFGGKPQGPPLDPDASALIARMTVEPDAGRKLLISNLVKALKDGGVWAKLDAFYVHAAHDSQAARLNWLGNVLELTAVSAPAFTVDRGYKGNGSSSYLAINGYDTEPVKMKQNDVSLGAWVQEVTAHHSPVIGGTSISMALYPLKADNTYVARVHCNENAVATSVNPLSMIHGTRAASAGLTFRQASSARNTYSRGPTSAYVPWRILSSQIGYGFSPNRVAASYFGAALTDAQELAMDGALTAYLTAVGAA